MLHIKFKSTFILDHTFFGCIGRLLWQVKKSRESSLLGQPIQQKDPNTPSPFISLLILVFLIVDNMQVFLGKRDLCGRSFFEAYRYDTIISKSFLVAI